jgi:hypothetical protein
MATVDLVRLNRTSVRFGSVAALQDMFSLMSAFGQQAL